MASAEARQERAAAEAKYGTSPGLKDIDFKGWRDRYVANVGGVVVGAAAFAAAMQGYDRYMNLINARDARGRRVSRVHRTPSSRSQRRDL